MSLQELCCGQIGKEKKKGGQKHWSSCGLTDHSLWMAMSSLVGNEKVAVSWGWFGLITRCLSVRPIVCGIQDDYRREWLRERPSQEGKMGEFFQV
jgi:hypothetical protein